MQGRLLALRLLGLGWYVATCLVVGVLAGVFLDQRLDLKPVFTLLGVILGTFAAFYGLYKMVRPLFSDGSTPGKPGADGEQNS